MAKVKYTKNELKAQRDALKRFQLYLPTLQLKQQLLQVELHQLEVKIRAKADEVRELQDAMEAWQSLFVEPIDYEDYLRLDAVRESVGNIAGVAIPVLEELVFARRTPDLFETPAWLDEGLRVLEQMILLRVATHVLRQQHRRIAEELRLTTQRINLFEKVKIPECQEHIRVIRIFLGDQQTASVARAKIAKGKAVAQETMA